MFTVIDGRSEPAIRRAHRSAIARGASPLPFEPERADPSAALMCGAACHALDLALLTQSFEAHADIVGDPADPLLEPVVRALRNTSATVVRSAWQALQAHGHDLGYRTECWDDRAIAVTSDVLRDEVGSFDPPIRPIPTDVARTAGHEVTLALQGTDTDPMGVPEHLACASGLAAALFMLAYELGRR